MITAAQAKFTVIHWPELEDKPEVSLAYIVWCIYTTPVYNEVVYCTLDLNKAEVKRDWLQSLYGTEHKSYCLEEIEID